MAHGGDSNRGEVLTGIARRAIEGQLLGEPAPDASADGADGDDVSWLSLPAATFVTLTRDGELRGCIGSLTQNRPLRDDVARNARAAAFEDPRFPAVTMEELDRLRIEVSVLEPSEPIECSSEAELLAALRPSLDGLTLECGSNRATFLPQVWERCPEPRRFVEALKRKAGLPEDFWSDEIRFFRYSVTAFEEE